MTPRTWQSNVRRKQRVRPLQEKPRRNAKRQHAKRRAKRRQRARPRVRKRRARSRRAKLRVAARRLRVKLRAAKKRPRARRAPVKRAHANRPVRRRPEKRLRVARQLAGRRLRKHNLTGVFNASCESLMRLAFFVVVAERALLCCEMSGPWKDARKAASGSFSAAAFFRQNEVLKRASCAGRKNCSLSKNHSFRSKATQQKSERAEAGVGIKNAGEIMFSGWKSAQLI